MKKKKFRKGNPKRSPTHVQGFLVIPKNVLPKRVQPKKKKKLSVLASLLFHDPDAPDFLRKSISDAGKTFYRKSASCTIT